MGHVQVRLGQKVRDAICGLNGIVTAISHELNGNRRICIQAEIRDGKVPDVEYCDEVGLDIVDPVAETARAVMPEIIGIRNGDSVRDRLTGFAGTVIHTIHYLNGCTQLAVTAHDLSPKDGATVTCYFDWQRLEKSPELKAPPSEPLRPNGGPRTRGMP